MKKLIVSSVVALSLVAGVASAQSYYPTTYTSTPTYTSAPTYSSGGCLSISSNLSVGSRGSQVLALQQFLVSQSYPGSGTWMETSYFGAATRAALVDFQQSHGLPQTGFVDSTTLSALNTCGGSSYTYPGYPASVYPTTYTNPVTYPYTNYTNPTTYPYIYGSGVPTITSLSQNTGTSGNTITIFGQGFDPSNNTVYFGGQSIPGVPSINGTSLSFTIPYLYSYSNNQTVQLYVTDSRGTSNSISFTLNPTAPIVCGGSYSYGNCGCSNSFAYTTSCSACGYNYSTYPYNTGCPTNTGTPVITYLNPQSGGVGTSVTVYGSGFTTSNNTVHFGNGIVTGLGSSDGQSLSFVVPAQITGFGSQPIVLGTYQISVTNGNGIASNSMPFTITSTVNGNGSPTISNVSGPTSLSTNTTGTWQVTINNPNSNYATVSVSWGDTGNGYVNQAAPQQISGGIQTVPFSHAYISSGTYTLTFTVGNPNGQSNTYTSSVIVSGSSNNGGTPSINYLSPSSGYVGTQVTVSGSNLSTNGSNTINFGSGAIQNVFSNGSSVTFTVPSSVGPYCQPGYACPQYLQQVTPGTYNVSVMNSYGTSNTIPFTVL